MIAYSTVGFTSVVYALDLMLSELMFKFCFKNLMVRFTLLQILLTCTLHFMLCVMVHTRYLAYVTAFSL